MPPERRLAGTCGIEAKLGSFSAMRSLLLSIRENLHPLIYIRKFPLARRILRVVDGPVWLTIPGVGFRAGSA